MHMHGRITSLKTDQRPTSVDTFRCRETEAACSMTADGSSIVAPGAAVAEKIRSALPDPARLSWMDFHAQRYIVTATDLLVAGNVTPDGKLQLSLTSGGIQVQVFGIGIDNKPFDLSIRGTGSQGVHLWRRKFAL